MGRLLLYFSFLSLLSCNQDEYRYNTSFYNDNETFGVVDSICERSHSVNLSNNNDTLIGEGLIIRKAKYNVNGQLLTEQHLNGIAPDSYSTYHYDDHKRLELHNIYSNERSNKPIESWSYLYDLKGNLIEENYYYEETDWTRTVGLHFDTKSKILNRTVITSNSSSSDKYEIIIDSNGNWIESRKYLGKDSQNLVELIEADYNAMNLLTKKVTHLKNNQSQISEYEYDRYGNTTSYKHTNIRDDKNDQFEFSYKYKFDSKGNWISKTTFRDGNCLSIITREIFYYKF